MKLLHIATNHYTTLLNPEGIKFVELTKEDEVNMISVEYSDITRTFRFESYEDALKVYTLISEVEF